MSVKVRCEAILPIPLVSRDVDECGVMRGAEGPKCACAMSEFHDFCNFAQNDALLRAFLKMRFSSQSAFF